MNKLVFKKSAIFPITMISLFFIIIFFCINKHMESSQTLSDNTLEDSKYDFDGDGTYDELQIINGQNKIDFNIKCSAHSYNLSDYAEDKTLFSLNHSFLPYVYINDISRDKVPEILLMGSKNNVNTCYISYFCDKKLKLKEIPQKNIVGLLDSHNSKTPQLFFINSKVGVNSLTSVMLANNEIIDTSKSNSNVAPLGSILKFINIIELPYTVDAIPDIFTQNIDSSNLSLLWNLNKDNICYSFQNAFFYDYEWDNMGTPSKINCRLSFEKAPLKQSAGSKEEMIISLKIEKVDSTYKISHIKIK